MATDTLSPSVGQLVARHAGRAKVLEANTHRHIHLENTVSFPRVVALASTRRT